MARKEKKVASASLGAGPSRVELSLIHEYLNQAGLKSTLSALEAEVSRDAHSNITIAGAPSLTDLLELWKKERGELPHMPVPEAKAKKPKVVKEASSSSQSTSNSSEPSSDSNSDDETRRDETDGHEAGMVNDEAESTGSSSSEEDSDSDSDSSSSDEEEAEDAKVTVKRKREATSSSSEDSSSEYSSSDEDDAPPAKRTKVEASSESASASSSDDDSDSSSSASEAAGDVDMDADTSSASSDSDSDSDSSNSESGDGSGSSSDSDSDSDSSSDSTSSPPPKKKAKVTVKKPESDSDSSAASSHTLTGSPAKSAPIAKINTEVEEVVVPAAAVENGNGDMHPDRLKRMPATKQTNKEVKKSNVPFSRIPKDTKVDEKFKSNEYVPYDYANKAYQDLIVTKGKGFTKEKNKKKRGEHRVFEPSLSVR